MWWTLFTIVLVALISFLVFWVINKKYSVRWYEWVLFFVGIVLMVFMLQNFFGAFAEGEPKPAWMFLWTLGIPALVLIVLPVILSNSRNKGEA